MKAPVLRIEDERAVGVGCADGLGSVAFAAHSLARCGAPLIERPWRLKTSDRLLISPTGVAVPLSGNEYTLLRTLCANDQYFATRDALIQRIDGVADARSAHRLEALVSRLRRKVHEKSGIRLPLCSEYGRGYLFAGPMHMGE